MTRRARLLFISFFVLYAISTAIVLIASTASNPMSVWGGYVDVGIVVLIALNGFAIYALNKSELRYEISHQTAIYMFPIILLGMWLYRNRLDFNILLPGLAWRTFFFLHILPYALNIWHRESAQ
jgi:hypothetical protein